jgi:hypothetical protein
LAVGDITVYTGLKSHGDTLTMASGVGKVLFFGISKDVNNVAITIAEGDGTTGGGEMYAQDKGGSNEGSTGWKMGSAATSNTTSTSGWSFYIDTVTGIRLQGNLLTSQMCNITWLQVS